MNMHSHYTLLTETSEFFARGDAAAHNSTRSCACVHVRARHVPRAISAQNRRSAVMGAKDNGHAGCFDASDPWQSATQ